MKRWLVLLIVAAMCVAPMSAALASEVETPQEAASSEEVEITLGGEAEPETPETPETDEASASAASL